MLKEGLGNGTMGCKVGTLGILVERRSIWLKRIELGNLN
jgi:hypothetical protein